MKVRSKVNLGVLSEKRFRVVFLKDVDRVFFLVEAEFQGLCENRIGEKQKNESEDWPGDFGRLEQGYDGRHRINRCFGVWIFWVK